MAASSFCEGDTMRVPGDHQIFVGRDRAHDATRLGRTDCTGVSIVACRIEFYPEKAQSLASAPLTSADLSPIPPVNTRRSSPPRADASAPICFLAW